LAVAGFSERQFAFIGDICVQRIVGWNTSMSSHTDLVPTCLRMGTLQRQHVLRSSLPAEPPDEPCAAFGRRRLAAP